MSQPPAIIYTDEPAGFCPVQAEGEIDGFPFYFRSRGGNMTLYVAAKPGGDARPPHFEDGNWHYFEPYQGRLFRPGERQFSAGYAEPDECREFIARAAVIWRKWRDGEFPDESN